MNEPAPLWFVILGAIILILYLLRNVLFGIFKDLLSVLRGKMSCLGCLFSTLAMILVVGLVIWCLVSELF